MPSNRKYASFFYIVLLLPNQTATHVHRRLPFHHFPTVLLSSPYDHPQIPHKSPPQPTFPFLALSAGGAGGDIKSNNNSGGGSGNDDYRKHGSGRDENAGDKNRKEAMIVLAEAGRSTDSLPKDLEAAIQAERIPATFPLHLHLRLSSSSSTSLRHTRPSLFLALSAGGDGGDINSDNNNSGGGGGHVDDGKFESGGEENAGDKNRKEAMIVLAKVERSTDSLSKDLATTIQAGRTPGSVIERFLTSKKSGFMRWLMEFGGFKERLLADDLFFAKVAIEFGVGIFTKITAEYERRIENFFKDGEIVSDIALLGTSYSLLQRVGAVMRNGTKLFAVDHYFFHGWHCHHKCFY